MLSAIPAEVLTMGITAIGGFIMKQQAEARKERHEEHLRAMERRAATEESMKRAASNGGKWIRRFLVAAFAVGVILLPFIAAVFTSVPMVIQHSETAGGWLWGLFGPEYQETIFTEVKGYWMAPETRHGLMAVIGFYFGQGAAK